MDHRNGPIIHKVLIWWIIETVQLFIKLFDGSFDGSEKTVQ